MSMMIRIYSLKAALVGTICLLWTQIAMAQQVKFFVLTPVAGEMVANSDLLISVRIEDANLHFAAAEHVQVFLDERPISGIVKIRDNRLDFLYIQSMPGGMHQIRLEVKIAELPQKQKILLDIQVGKKKSSDLGYKSPADTQLSAKSRPVLDGILVADNRSVALSGSGRGLRQEPAYTRTLSLDVAGRYKGVEVPVKLFLTTDNSYALQDRNYYQLGIRTRWLEVFGGDLNPVFDRLVLTGVRVRGVSVMLKSGNSSLQCFYGDMNQSHEGSLALYTPGTGTLPTNLINDSQYIVPGVYRRSLMGARLQTGNRGERFRLGFSAIKVKDDVQSIRYGLSPKDNIAGGVDLLLRLFRKRLILEGGIAGSVYTSDISGGVISKEALDTAYNQRPPFDPADYRDIIILNASTLPNDLSSLDNLAYYTQATYTGRHQSLFIEYRKNGATYYSLGNPFLRNNYEGINARERIFFFRRKMALGVGCQNYTTSLNNVATARVRTEGYSGNVLVNPGGGWPSVVLNYVRQVRSGKSETIYMQGVDEVLNNFMCNLSLNRNFWKMNHHFRAVLTVNERDDKLRPANKFTTWNGVLGLGETIRKSIQVNAEFGKALIQGSNALGRISDVTIYSVSTDWQINDKYQAGFSASNYHNLATAVAPAFNRLSLIGRFSYSFLRGMRLDFETGYLPYRETVNTLNNYEELYGYVRYTCELGKLTGWK